MPRAVAERWPRPSLQTALLALGRVGGQDTPTYYRGKNRPECGCFPNPLRLREKNLKSHALGSGATWFWWSVRAPALTARPGAGGGDRGEGLCCPETPEIRWGKGCQLPPPLPVAGRLGAVWQPC